MPTYEYRCSAGHQFEQFQRMSEPPLDVCPTCGAPAERQLSAGVGLLFKGSGFYITDYRSDAYRKAAEADRGAPAEKSGAGEKSGAVEKSSAAEKSGAEKGGSSGKAASAGESGAKPSSADGVTKGREGGTGGAGGAAGTKAE